MVAEHQPDEAGKQCAGCGKNLEQKTRGRSKRWCSAACRQRGQRQRDKQRLSSLPSATEVIELRRKVEQLEQQLHEAQRNHVEQQHRADLAESQLRYFQSWLDAKDEGNLIIAKNMLLDCHRQLSREEEIPQELKPIVSEALCLADVVSILLPAKKQKELRAAF